MPERHIYRGMILKGRSIAKGTGSGELLYTDTPISFLGGVDAATGIVIDEKHPLHGQSVAGKVLAFPYGKGSTVGSYVMYGLAAGCNHQHRVRDHHRNWCDHLRHSDG